MTNRLSKITLIKKELLVYGHRLRRRFLFIAVWVLGVGMTLYGGLGLISDVLHVTRIINDPEIWKWFFWYLVIWDPWWVLGGVLFLATAWFTRRRDITAEGNALERAH